MYLRGNIDNLTSLINFVKTKPTQNLKPVWPNWSFMLREPSFQVVVNSAPLPGFLDDYFASFSLLWLQRSFHWKLFQVLTIEKSYRGHKLPHLSFALTQTVRHKLIIKDAVLSDLPNYSSMHTKIKNKYFF